MKPTPTMYSVRTRSSPPKRSQDGSCALISLDTGVGSVGLGCWANSVAPPRKESRIANFRHGSPEFSCEPFRISTRAGCAGGHLAASSIQEVLLRSLFTLAIALNVGLPQPPQKPACNAQTRGELWPPRGVRDPSHAAEMCVLEVWKYRWEQVTVPVPRSVKDSRRSRNTHRAVPSAPPPTR